MKRSSKVLPDPYEEECTELCTCGCMDFKYDDAGLDGCMTGLCLLFFLGMMFLAILVVVGIIKEVF